MLLKNLQHDPLVVRRHEIAALAEAFTKSDLPCKVDLVDWQAADKRWRELVALERIALTEPARPRRR